MPREDKHQNKIEIKAEEYRDNNKDPQQMGLLIFCTYKEIGW